MIGRGFFIWNRYSGKQSKKETSVTCKSCQERRIRLNRERAKRSKQGKVVQAAAIFVAVSTMEAVAKALGLEGEKDEKLVRSTGSFSPEDERQD